MKLIASTFFIFVSALFIFSCQLVADPGQKQSEKIASGSADTAVQTSTPSERRGFYNWLIKEMYEQVFLRSPSPKTDIAGWANVFSQGGSIEGVYHGLILSTEYSNMERGRAALKSVRFFAEEMARLEGYDPSKKDSEATLKKESEKFVRENMQSSVFTLKRILGEKLLSEIAKKKSDRNKLAMWFAETAVRWAKLDISFGMTQRNSTDLDFHKKWAEENSIGLLQWEILNRAHRILNDHNGLIISPADK